MKPQNSSGWSWIALCAVLLNVAFNYAYQRLPLGLQDMRAVSDRYANPFTPAPYAFSIWGLIYLAWIVYAVRSVIVYRSATGPDRLAPPLAFVNVLGSAWIVAFTANRIGLSLFLLAATLIGGATLFSRSHKRVGSRWGTVPFSLFAAWITVAFIANATAWWTSTGGIVGPIVTVGLIAVTVLIGLTVGYRFADPVYPLVLAWADLAIWVKQRGALPPVAHAGRLAAFVLLLGALISAVRIRGASRPVPAGG